jgi:hypothetical protein
MAIKSPLGVAFLGLGRMGETHLRNIEGLPGRNSGSAWIYAPL